MDRAFAGSPQRLSPVADWVTLDMAVGFRVPFYKIWGLGLDVFEGSITLRPQVFSVLQEVWLDTNWWSCQVGDMEGSALRFGPGEH